MPNTFPQLELLGLTSSEAAKRLGAGEGNRPSKSHGRTVYQIVRANVFTRFNAILSALLIVIVGLGPVRDGLFGVVLVANAIIGIGQEVLAKRTSDRLNLVTTSRAVVRRDGKEVNVATWDVVRGDLVALKPGGQVIVDGPVVASDGLEVDESLLTGEAEPKSKLIDDFLRSGSFVVAGSGWMLAELVGDDSFANSLSAKVHEFVPVKSELAIATDQVLRIVTWAIGPIACALLVGQWLGGESWKSAILGAATGVVEIVPEGFVLLTSMTLAVSVIRLGRSGVLVKELGAVEGLARVDVMCFDKTGTLTEGDPVVEEIEIVGGVNREQAHEALRLLTAGSANGTGQAIQLFLGHKDDSNVGGDLIPFSSSRKWAALTQTLNGQPQSWVMGAPEIVMSGVNKEHTEFLAEVAQRTRLGLRVLALASVRLSMPSDRLPAGLEPCALIILRERVRTDAKATLSFFEAEGVTVKIISGDSPETVVGIARSAGVLGLEVAGAVVDARSLVDNKAIADAMASAVVIGRTSPDQKQEMVRALRSTGHTVAMTGDGVNDVLALKKANLGIAMGAGSDATKAVAQLVLVNGNFASLPGVVAEGRRVIANVERLAKLFITKSVYAAALAIATGIARLPFPFLPRQLTLISALTIGIPGLFLALAPQAPLAKPGFMKRIGIFAVPAGLVAAVATFAAYRLVLLGASTSVPQARTAASLVLGVTGVWIVDVLARPHSKWRVLLICVITSLGAACQVVPSLRNFWGFTFPDLRFMLEAGVIAFAAIVTVELGWRYGTKLSAN